jgi:hypothetical protein
MLASSIHVRGFKPGRSRRIFQAEKILSISSGGEVKPSVPCRRFAACKRYLNGVEKASFRQNYRTPFSPTVPPFVTRSALVVRDVKASVGERGRRKWERLKAGESNDKLPLRTCPECSVPEPYRSPDWALVPAKTGPSSGVPRNLFDGGAGGVTARTLCGGVSARTLGGGVYAWIFFGVLTPVIFRGIYARKSFFSWCLAMNFSGCLRQDFFSWCLRHEFFGVFTPGFFRGCLRQEFFRGAYAMNFSGYFTPGIFFGVFTPGFFFGGFNKFS